MIYSWVIDNITSVLLMKLIALVMVIGICKVSYFIGNLILGYPYSCSFLKLWFIIDKRVLRIR